MVSHAMSPFWRFTFILAIFQIIWPLVSVILVWLTRFNDDGWVDSAIFYLIYGYPIFIPPAVLAGVVCAVAAVRFGHNSVWIAVGAALAAEALLITVAVLMMSPDALARGNITIGLGFSLLLSLMAALTCWRLSWRFARAS